MASQVAHKLVDEFDAYSQVFVENKKYRRREIFYLAFCLLHMVCPIHSCIR